MDIKSNHMLNKKFVLLFVFLILIVSLFVAVLRNEKKEVAYTFEDSFLAEGFYYVDDLTHNVAIGGTELVCTSYPVENPEDPSQCTPFPKIPYSVFKQQGYDEFFVREGKVFPYKSTLCADIPLQPKSREWMLECMKRNGIDPEKLPPITPPPKWIKPTPPEEEKEYIPVFGEARISPEGKLFRSNLPLSRARRAIGARITPAAIQSLETALQNYINTILNPVANCRCNMRNGNDTCTQCCEWNGACCVTDPVSGRCLARCCSRWCNTGECPPGSGAGGPTSPCPGGVPCPASACPQNPYLCQDIPVVSDCATKDSMICGSTDGSCNMVGGFNACGQDNCVSIGTLSMQIADCPNFNDFSCTPLNDNNCNNDGLIIDIVTPSVRLETFTRIANFVSNITGCAGNVCNNSQVEITCNQNCGTNQTCGCRCCGGSQAGCGLINWPPGCPCCDDDMRLSINFSGGLAVYGIAFLLYGPPAAPDYATPCGNQPASWSTNYPGEWINLCACVQNASLGSYNAEVCRGGFCGFLMELLVDWGLQDIRCTVVRQLNSLIGGALKSLLGTLPISAMEELGACGTPNYNLGIYPELCASGSLGYSYNYSQGGAGLNLFLDTAIQVTTQNSCVIGTCPQYPTQVAASICGDTTASTNVHNCLPNLNNYDIGVFVQQETINELLYMAWTQGYLCQSFNIPREVAQIIIPGVRQLFPSSTTVRVEFRPVCTNPTPTFSTGAGSSFTISIPEFRVRFTATPPSGPAQDLFELRVSANASGVLQRVIGGCHPNDTLCQTNPTFRCRRCTGVGSCTTDLIQYGGGWLQITNFQVDPVVFGVASLNPSINLTPPYTEIGDLIGNLLGGLLDNAALRTRIYDLFIVPLQISGLVNTFGFAHNALVVNLDLPDPFCLNFILDFGNFAPTADVIRKMAKDNYWPVSLSPLSKILESGEITEEQYNEILKELDKQKEQNFIRTFISVYETDEKGNRLGTYAEDSKFVDIKVPFRSKQVKVKLKAEPVGFYPDGTSEIKFAWKRKNGYFWYNIDGDEFYFKPLTRNEEIELFAFVQQKYEPNEPPKSFILAYDKFPAILRVKKGLLDGNIVGPDKVVGGKEYYFEVKPEVEALYYSTDGGNSWSERIEGSRFKVLFPENLTSVEILVEIEKGDEKGYITKVVKIEEQKKGCGSLFGIIPIFGMIFFSIFSRISNNSSKRGDKYVSVLPL